MSLITAFPFHAYVGDLKTRPVVDAKVAVSLSLLTSEDMTRMAFVEVRTRAGQEDKSAPWRPVVRGGEEHPTFYDPRMGNFDVRTFPPHSCQTCATTLTGKYGNERCQGHFGFVGMPRLFPGNDSRGAERMYVMNPHLMDEAEQLLQAKCFFCHKFRAPLFDVERYRQALRLIDSGLIGEALHLLDVVANARGHDVRSRRLHTANEEVISDVTMLNEHVERIRLHNAAFTGEGTSKKNVKGAMDIRNGIARQALRDLREFTNVCSHCNGVSPRITKRNGHFFFFFSKSSSTLNIANGRLSLEQLRLWEENNRLHRRSHTYFRSMEIREHLKQLCLKEDPLIGLLFPHLGEPSVHIPNASPLQARNAYKVYFVDRVLVPPLPLRLSSGVQVQDSGAISPDAQTRSLSDILGFVEQIECYQTLKNNSTKDRNLVTSAQELANEINLRNLQVKVNEVYQSILDTFAKKEGLFRMNMMGKRVNQACRSVISPDPLVEPNEVLLPRPFSRSLSFPEQVTSYAPARMDLLKRCVINGPHRYPGATHMEIRHSNGEIRFVDLNVSEQARRQHAAKYFALAQSGVTLIIFRHILDGDRVVFNRQPTLHKPSMMGYRVKVLSGFKTLRFHYVNGSSFNADFDGDEMNIHVPQSLEAKAELDCLMDANLNYLVPTSGRPIRGLIQDHVAAGVLLTLRDKFLDHGTFVQFVYYGLAPYMQHHREVTLSGMIPIPAILLPRPLWTGKQLISVIVRFVTGGNPRREEGEGVTLRGTSLIQPSSYNHTKLGEKAVTNPTRDAFDDDGVLFMNGELLVGLMCKKQLGASNMSVAHVVHELYGPHKVGQLFGALCRILTLSLQREGFSMGMDDMCLVHEERRCKLLRQLDEAPLKLPDDEATAMSKIMEHATNLQKEFMPGRMMISFPHNQLLTMTQSGAKGSNANATQMSLGLGQQLFDGRRVKRMNSGKTLPPFFAHECRARSFGYAIGSFASGIRPSEYTIHAMAGRDGLIDTAVKTSRSGHLQRCLIKGLESLVVHWDHSVRDSNGDVVQFLYGGDGLDPCKASTLTNWEMAKENLTDLTKRFLATDDDDTETVGDDPSGATSAHLGTKRPRGGRDMETECNASCAIHASNQIAENPLPEYMRKDLDAFLTQKATFPLIRKPGQIVRWGGPQRVHEKLMARRQECIRYYAETIGDLTAAKRLRAFCDAGEPVGLLAAQAAGEPSTQMTLNTFHSAGSTVTHVTEGIPRLRELLIHASVQKAAVVVPVVGAQAADEAAIAKILRAGVPTRLVDCLVRGKSGKGYHYHMKRGPESTVLTIALLFSRSALSESRLAMCMSHNEHVDAFVLALRQLVKRIVRNLRGRTRDEKESDETGMNGSGGIAGTIAAAAASAGIAAVGFDGFNGDDRGSVDEDMLSRAEDNDSDSASDVENRLMDNEDAVKSVSPAMRSQHGPSDVGPIENENGNDDENGEHDEDDDEDEDNNDTIAKYYQKRKKHTNNHNDEDEDNEDERKERGGEAMRNGEAQSYSAFAPLRNTFNRNEFVAEVAPLCPLSAARAGVPELPDDLFFVNVILRMPSHIVVVIPDLLEEALEQHTLPSWLPQFGSLTFSRKADDPTSGELVFQGENAKMRQVLSFLSLFTVRAKAIKLSRARSTDIRDMANWFGVESANKALYDELSKLFKRYSVDHRHLTLIADTATHRGVWENFNFTGVISHSANPLFQMTFASSKRWLHTAVTRGLSDDLQSISSAIMVGERPKVGTACVKLHQDAAILRDVVARNFS